MKKIVLSFIASIVLSCSMMYACSSHCDFDNPQYEKEAIIFDMAMELYNDFEDENISIEECLEMARAMYEMNQAQAELNRSMMK